MWWTGTSSPRRAPAPAFSSRSSWSSSSTERTRPRRSLPRCSRPWPDRLDRHSKVAVGALGLGQKTTRLLVSCTVCLDSRFLCRSTGSRQRLQRRVPYGGVPAITSGGRRSLRRTAQRGVARGFLRHRDAAHVQPVPARPVRLNVSYSPCLEVILSYRSIR